MEKFFESNQGLKSRFNYFIEFGDYSSKELMTILEHLCRQDDYKLSNELKLSLERYLNSEIQKKYRKFFLMVVLLEIYMKKC